MTDKIIASSNICSSNGVLQPYRLLGWWQWMYRLSPYTYLIEALLGQAVGRQSINCSPIELVTVNPPGGQSCSAYLGPYISMAGGYVTNPDATSACQFCSARTTDEWLGLTFNISWEHHWRNFGFMWIYIIFNIVLIFAFSSSSFATSSIAVTRSPNKLERQPAFGRSPSAKTQ